MNKSKTAGKGVSWQHGFVGLGPMGIYGVIKLCGHCDPGIMALGHSFAIVLLKNGGDGPCFCSTGRQVLLF